MSHLGPIWPNLDAKFDIPVPRSRLPDYPAAALTVTVARNTVARWLPTTLNNKFPFFSCYVVEWIYLEKNHYHNFILFFRLDAMWRQFGPLSNHLATMCRCNHSQGCQVGDRHSGIWRAKTVGIEWLPTCLPLCSHQSLKTKHYLPLLLFYHQMLTYSFNFLLGCKIMYLSHLTKV